MQHHVFMLTFGGKIYNAPLDKSKVHRVLDIGTGTGIWAIDYGKFIAPRINPGNNWYQYSGPTPGSTGITHFILLIFSFRSSAYIYEGRGCGCEPNPTELVRYVTLQFASDDLTIPSVPPNLQFEIDDVEKPWSYSQKFDFIFSRMMTGSFPDWPAYITNCFKYILIPSSSVPTPFFFDINHW